MDIDIRRVADRVQNRRFVATLAEVEHCPERSRRWAAPAAS
ncbi:MAG: hypothetical protein QOG44_1324 [Acidimicrobiaceae bacterium]|nr:hypothetical protein [Acidimicrobiaceae bacterium]